MPSKNAKSAPRRARTIRVDLIGRKGRKIGFGAVQVPGSLVTRKGAELVALGVYRARFPGWKWEAVAL